jgi:2-C-methyl-D-erythritol 4-phosphate cytidylyltransferase
MLGRVYTIVPAAGSAIRMGLGYSKAYVDVAGKPLIARTMESLLASPFIDRLTVAVRPDEVALAGGEIVEKLGLSDRVKVIAGGEKRQQTVDKLLAAAPPERDLVLIHDGARPLVSINLIHEVLEAAAKWGAAIAAIPITDTIKESTDGGETVSGTVNRTGLFRAQTPQVFHKDIIVAAHRRALKERWEVTDDASLIEQMGHEIRIVTGEERNLKVTTLDDLELVRWIIQSDRI